MCLLIHSFLNKILFDIRKITPKIPYNEPYYQRGYTKRLPLFNDTYVSVKRNAGQLEITCERLWLNLQ